MSSGLRSAGLLEPGTLVGGDFEIERLLGQGGMGTVYAARQRSTHKARAVKIMHPRLAPDMKSRRRFIEEARVAARIESEHVVETVGAGVDEESGAPWIAMELLEGEDLDARVERAGPLSIGELRDVMSQLRHALRAAHAAGIVHRDLKPENLFFARSKREGAEHVLKVLDFGIAKALSEAQPAMVTTTLGSPFWMAPEQAQVGAALQPATDVWAIGLVAFFLRTGRRYWRTGSDPSRPGSPAALLAEMMVDEIDPPSMRARELGSNVALSREFDDWFAHCVVREPEGRFREAGAALSALEAALDAEEGHAARVAPPTPTPAARPAYATPAAHAHATAPMPYSPTIHVPPPPAPRRTGVRTVVLSLALVAVLGLVATGGWVAMRGRGGESPRPPVTPAALVTPPPMPPSPPPPPPPEPPIPRAEPVEVVPSEPPAAPSSPRPVPRPTPRPVPTPEPPPRPSPRPEPPTPPPPTPPPPAPPAREPTVRTFEAGPLWNQAHAESTCPGLCTRNRMRWNGQWWTTEQGRMSVCQCTSE